MSPKISFAAITPGGIKNSRVLPLLANDLCKNRHWLRSAFTPRGEPDFQPYPCGGNSGVLSRDSLFPEESEHATCPFNHGAVCHIRERPAWRPRSFRRTSGFSRISGDGAIERTAGAGSFRSPNCRPAV